MNIYVIEHLSLCTKCQADHSRDIFPDRWQSFGKLLNHLSVKMTALALLSTICRHSGTQHQSYRQRWQYWARSAGTAAHSTKVIDVSLIFWSVFPMHHDFVHSLLSSKISWLSIISWSSILVYRFFCYNRLMIYVSWTVNHIAVTALLLTSCLHCC